MYLQVSVVLIAVLWGYLRRSSMRVIVEDYKPVLSVQSQLQGTMTYCSHTHCPVRMLAARMSLDVA